MTQNGKTHFSIYLANKFKGPVLFINPQKERIKGFVKANCKDEIKDIARAMRAGDKINYIPSTDDEIAVMELAYIVEHLFKYPFAKNNPCLLVIDETHIFSNSKAGKLTLRKIANRGLSYGINALFISQRFANVEYTTVTQSEQHFIFKLGFEKEYFQRKGVPYEEIIRKIDKKGKYSFVVWDGMKFSDAQKI
jgi:hypothetical protein